MLVYKAVDVPNVLTPAECNRVIQRANEEGWKPGEVWTTKEPLTAKVNRTLINADRSHLTDEWLLDKLRVVFDEINDKNWQFKIDGKVSARVARYKTGGFFVKHTDLGGSLGFNRKLTISVQLSDPKAYDGGLLVLICAGQMPLSEQGSGLMYPSFIPHEIRKVERGTRYSLVAWVDGQEPFK